MMFSRRTLLVGAAAAALPGRLLAAPPTALELGVTGMTRLADDLWIKAIGVRTWLFSFTAPIDGGKVIYPANGVLHQHGNQLVLIDPGWNPAQADALISWCRREHGRTPTGAIVTHFHEDRIGGIPALDRAGIAVAMSPITRAMIGGVRIAPDALPGPFAERHFGLETYYPGAAHSPDNIVVWLADERTLVGGCMIKSVTSPNLGNLGDASIPAWRDSIERVATLYGRAARVIPGHGTISGDPIGKTRALLADA